MTFKIIHPQFEFDLPHGFTRNIINNLFQETPTYNYTYPFTLEVDDEKDERFKYITELNNKNIVSLYDVILEGYGRQYKAVLHIDTIIGKRIEVRVVYGMETFPNEFKMLSDLPLYKQEIDKNVESIYSIAESIKSKTWPEVPYNFPAVHVTEDVVNTGSEEWEFFKGTINLRDSNGFVQNDFDDVEYLHLNYNIMQPVPFAMHILQKGFEDAGYELTGDILEDNVLKKTMAFNFSEFYSSISDEERQEYEIKQDEYTGPGYYSEPFVNKDLTIYLPTPGRYKISGNLYLLYHPSTQVSTASFNYKGRVVESYSYAQTNVFYKYFNIDFNLEVRPGESNVPVDFKSFISPLPVSNHDGTILDITVSKLVSYDSEGNNIPTLQEASVIDLRECVPKVTFFEYFEAIRKIRGYAPGVADGNKFIVNKMRLGNRNQAIDLSHYEYMPERNTNKNKGFLFTYKDQVKEYDEDIYETVLATTDDRIINPYRVDDEITHFVFEAYPLKSHTRNLIDAVLCFQDEETDICLIGYNHLIQESYEIETYFMQSLIELYNEFIRVSLENISFIEEIKVYSEDVSNITESSTIYMYGMYHLLDHCQITTVNDKVSTVVLEMKSL